MSTEKQNEGFKLFDELHYAKSQLLSVGAYLVAEAIDEGDPGRDIEAHPDYIEAKRRLDKANSDLNRFAVSSAIDFDN